MSGVKLKNIQTEEETEMAVKGVFMAIGHIPNTSFLDGTGIALDNDGYVKIAMAAPHSGYFRGRRCSR